MKIALCGYRDQGPPGGLSMHNSQRNIDVHIHASMELWRV